MAVMALLGVSQQVAIKNHEEPAEAAVVDAALDVALENLDAPSLAASTATNTEDAPGSKFYYRKRRQRRPRRTPPVIIKVKSESDEP